jgi:hypothetical protein
MAHKYPTAKALLFFYFSFDIYHFKVDWISVSHSINLKSGSPGTSKHIRIQSKQVHTLLFPAKHYFNKQNSTTVQDQEEVDNHPDWSVSQIMPPKTAHPVADLQQEKKCKGCNEVVHPNPDTGKVDVQEHKRGSLVHRAEAEGRTSCPWCGKYCDPEGKGELFLDHAHAEHPEINLYLDQQPTCLICGMKWPNKWYEEQHIAMKHPILWPPLTRPPPPPQGLQQAPPPQQGPLHCHICYTDVG